MLKTFNCVMCGKEVDRYICPSNNPKNVYCNHKCKSEHQKILLVGINNPHYKNLDRYSVCQCGKEKDIRAIKCINCRSPSIKIDTLRKCVSDSKNFTEATELYNKTEKVVLGRGHITKQIKKHNICHKHFAPGRSRPIPPESVFRKDSIASRGVLKVALHREGEKFEECQKCHIKNWNNEPISMEIHHINGDSTDHRKENLQILCPNCHSQTPTHRGKSRK